MRLSVSSWSVDHEQDRIDVAELWGGAHRPVVLLVEDSATARAVVRRCLDRHGFEVIEANDGEEALSKCRASLPDVVLLDIEMPKMNGYQVIGALKADPQVRSIPVVFLTGRDAVEDVAEGLRLGGHDYLRKPFEEIELLARISAAARLKSLQDELAARHEQLLEVSRRDVLTGLHNRRYLEEQLTPMASSALRHQQPLSAVMVDIDHFKTVNDTYGHPAGDAVLSEIAERMRAILRVEDALGRWGGEEFLVLLPQTDSAGAGALSERLRLAVARTPFDVGSALVPVTISLGYATTLRRDGPRLVRRADAALYQAKAGGRDRAQVAPVETD